MVRAMRKYYYKWLEIEKAILIITPTPLPEEFLLLKTLLNEPSGWLLVQLNVLGPTPKALRFR